MFLEPALQQLDSHVTTLDSRFERMENLLTRMVENQTAEVERDQWKYKSVYLTQKITLAGEEKSQGELRNDTGSGWFVEWVSSFTVPVTFYRDALGVSGFLYEITAGSAPGTRVKWYVPPGGIIYTIAAKEMSQECVNFYYREFAQTPARASTGNSGERIESPDRLIPIPSGHPLDYAGRQ